jgi:hypothetical protein
MLENAIALVVSFIFAGIMVYVVEKKFGGPDDSETLL